MKLRLENGNFKIVETLNPDKSYSYNKLPKGLLLCDFLGCVVERAELSVVATIMSAGEVEDTSLFVLSSSDGFQLFYNPLTGEVATAEDGSGGGSGSGYSVTKTEEVILPETTFQVESSGRSYKLESMTYAIDNPYSLDSVPFCVTFDGNEYLFNRLAYDGSSNTYAFYTCEFGSERSRLFLRVRKDGTTDDTVGWFITPNDTSSHILKVEAIRYDVTVTDEFRLAVQQAING